jgi:hypothetical protein
MKEAQKLMNSGGRLNEEEITDRETQGKEYDFNFIHRVLKEGFDAKRLNELKKER